MGCETSKEQQERVEREEKGRQAQAEINRIQSLRKQKWKADDIKDFWTSEDRSGVYQVITSSSSKGLVEKVTTAIQFGWEVQGSISASTTMTKEMAYGPGWEGLVDRQVSIFAQAVIRKKP
jgi:hypothetical protein